MDGRDAALLCSTHSGLLPPVHRITDLSFRGISIMPTTIVRKAKATAWHNLLVKKKMSHVDLANVANLPVPVVSVLLLWALLKCLEMTGQ